ncbi:MAG TPA: hypothetical protein VN397_03015 [Candidatus Methylomirabilis sp.]|nr:hypothetical protein [Candidatus Methylomirabilis sp.]
MIMNKENWQWLLLALVVVGLVGLGTMFVNQGSQLSQMAQSLNIVASKVQELAQTQNAPVVTQPVVTTEPTAVPQVPSAPSDDHKVITQKTVSWNGVAVQFAQRCKGQAKVGYVFGGEQQPISYCIGENQLVFIDAASNVKVLKTQTVSTAADALVLLGADLVPGSQKGAVLISYTVETCTTTNDCGAGMPTNYVRWVYNLSDQSLRGLSKYPDYGRPTWNPSGTKAVFIPDTCGGAGCDVAPLTGYDLLADTAKSVTTVKAAGTDGGQAQDVSGTRLQQWGSVTWKNDTDFTATYFPTDGTTKQAVGKF